MVLSQFDGNLANNMCGAKNARVSDKIGYDADDTVEPDLDDVTG